MFEKYFILFFLNFFVLLVSSQNALIVPIPYDGVQELPVGSSVEIGCKYDGTFVEWRLNGKKIEDLEDNDNNNYKLLDDNKLKIKNGRRFQDEGQYMCIYSNNVSATINVTAKPLLDRILPLDATTDGKSINVIEDSNLKLQCTANSTLNVTFTWFAIRNITKPDNERQYITDNVTVSENGFVSWLVLNDLTRDSRAYYGCEVTDSLSRSVNHIVLIRIKSKYGALWPFIGILGEVVILCTVIFIYEKRRQKPDFSDASDNINESHSPLAQGSSKGQEIRQRK